MKEFFPLVKWEGGGEGVEFSKFLEKKGGGGQIFPTKREGLIK